MGDAGEAVVKPDLGLVEGDAVEELISVDGGASAGGKGGGHDGDDAVGRGGETLVEGGAQLGADVAAEGGVDLLKTSWSGWRSRGPCIMRMT
jgi:hypothetical protein